MFSLRHWLQFSSMQKSACGPTRYGRNAFLTRPALELLEDRTLLNNRFVVPAGVPIDNATYFGSLQTALMTSGLQKGDVIQIEPGSSPGDVTNSVLTAPAMINLTIQGDPFAALTTIPQFTISDAVTIPASMNNLTLSNLNIGLVSAGSLTFAGAVTIAGSSIVDISSTSHSAVHLAPHGDAVFNLVTNSTFSIQTNAALGHGSPMVQVTPSTGNGCKNVFSNNLFVGNVVNAAGYILLDYNGPSGTEISAAHDLVENNTFVGMLGSNLLALFYDEAGASGLTVENNTFSDPDGGVTAIWLDNSPNTVNQQTILENNVISLPGGHTIGMQVEGGNGKSALEVALLIGNQIATNDTDGTGLFINTIITTTNTIFVQATRNNFQINHTGVLVSVGANTANLTVDLGGGNNLIFGTSPGANDFRGLPSATSTQGPIRILGTQPAAAIKITAKNDLFSNTTPLSFANVINVTVDATSNLIGNAAFVESLYLQYLQRSGNTAQGGDAFFWVNALATGAMTQAQVVNGICRSQEALGFIVDGLYEKILNRASDTSGRAALVAMLMNGATVEQLTTIMATSPEYANQTGSNVGYVQSLYVKLLGRIGSNAEISGWLAMLTSTGRAAVANSLLSSMEFRSDVVQQFYGFTPAPALSEASLFLPILHRSTAPMPAEINGWVSSSQDVLSIEFSFLGTQEFFANG